LLTCCVFFGLLLNHHIPTPIHHSISTLHPALPCHPTLRNSAPDSLREEKEACRKREEEQERLEEEVLQKELKRVEAEEKKRKEEEAKRREAEERQRKEKEAKAALAATEAKKRVEAEQGKKRGRAGLVKVVIGTRMLDEKGVVWFAQEGVVCGNYEKSGERCMWRDAASTRAKACWPCALMKKECPVPETRRARVAKGNAESGPEAGSSKKRKLAPKEKGKGKEKERGVSELEVGADAGTALLEEVQRLRDNVREVATIGRAIHHLLKGLDENLRFIAYHVEKRFGPEVTGGGEEMEEGEGKEGGGDTEGSGGAGVEGNIGSENEVEGTLV
jgi:hypothetical protein